MAKKPTVFHPRARQTRQEQNREADRRRGSARQRGYSRAWDKASTGPVAGQGFVFARDEKQAKIVFDKMKTMIAFSPSLSKRITTFKKSLWIPQIRAAFELLSGKAEGKHGRSPTVITGDEMHEWESLELKTTLRQGSIWQLMQAFNGWRKAQGMDDRTSAPSDAEFEAAVAAGA